MIYPWLDEAQQQFERRFDNKRLAHACLLAGPRGLGKLELAKHMAIALLCQQAAHVACGLCRSCQLFISGAHPDFRCVTFELNIKTDKMRTELVVEQVRDLNASMQLTHHLSPRKVALIYPAEALNRNAANALLKTLEEPPGDAVLLLVANDPSRLSATIRSRCQTILIRPPDEPSALDWLLNSTVIDAEAATMALKASAGSPLLARQMLADGSMTQYRTVVSLLERVEADETEVADVLRTWSELDQNSLWNWLSLIAAERLRACFNQSGRHLKPKEKLVTKPSLAYSARQISGLQTLADHNRRAMATSLRKELLLRDWLIQWSRLTSS